MPTQITSQYEVNWLQERNAAHQQKALQRAIQWIRDRVERVIRLDIKASKLEQKASEVSQSAREAADATAQDSTVWTRWRIFWSIAFLAAAMDYIAAGHIGEALAQMISPLFHPLNTETKMASFFIRQFAVITFIAGMVGATLTAKFLSSWALVILKAARVAAQPGQHLHFWGSTIGIGAVYVAKLSYVAVLGAFYLWLFGFAREYAIQSAAAEQARAGSDDQATLSIALDGGAVTAQDAGPHERASGTETVNDAAVAERLAAAPKVYYGIILMIHAALIFFPTSGFVQARQGANQARLVERIGDARAQEERILRDIYERIRLAPPGYQQDLVYAAEPVVPKINKLYGSLVIRIAGRDQNSTFNGEEPGDVTAGFASPSPGTPNGPTPNGTGAVAGSGADRSGPEEAVTTWDTIFPGNNTPPPRQDNSNS